MPSQVAGLNAVNESSKMNNSSVTAIRNFPNRQRGMGKWGWLFFIIVTVFAGSAALRLGPHYIDFRVVQGVIDRLPESRVHDQMTRGEIREHFEKQFRIENFRMKARDIVKVERTREQTVVDVTYEIREHLVYNIDVVLSFSEQRTYEPKN